MNKGTAEDKPPKLWLNLNFGENPGLTGNGAQILVDHLTKIEDQIGVKMLKFYKCNMGDDCGTRLARFIRFHPEPLEELHLTQ